VSVPLVSPSDAAIGRLVAAISRVETIETAYEHALTAIEEAVRPDRAAILVIDDAGMMRFCAAHGLSDDYCRAVEGHSPWAPDAVDPEPVLVSDVREAPSLSAFRAVIEREGVAALGFVPLVARRLIGKFMLYFDRPHTFTAAEVAAARTIADLVAFAIERLRTEAALRRSQEFLNSIVESSPDCIKVLDLDGRILSMSTGGQRLLELSDLSTVLGAPWVEFWSEPQRVAARQALVSAAAGEEATFEGFGPTGRGRLRWWEVRLTPLRTTTGAVERLLVISRDVTERRRSQALIIGQNHALELIARGEPLDVVLATLVRVVEEQEPGAVASILLLDEEGRRLHNGASPSLPADYLAAIDGIEIDPEVGTCAAAAARREVVVTPDFAACASWRGLAHLPLALGFRGAWSMPIISGSGRVLGTFGTYFREVRTPTAAERDTVQTLTRTAAVAIDRARAQDALARALEREQDARVTAEEANRAKDEFLATLSHELRTPLTAMLGWTRVLRNGQLGAPAAVHALASVERSTRLLSQLIDDLLDVSRIVSGKLVLERRAIQLAPVVQAAVEAVRHAADEKGVALDVSLPESSAVVWGDSTRLQQVVWNVVVNAVKFTPPGGRVSVRLERGGAEAVVTVTDTGRGIRPELLPYIFDRFRQSDGSSRRQHGGLGLGLAIVRQLVDVHGGSIRVTSAGEGQGATFAIALPLMAPGAGADEGPTPGSSSLPRLDAVRVLLVEDDPEARALFVTMLHHSGAAVVATGSVDEALRVLHDESPDVIVADISMPVRDGFDLVRAIRRLPGARGQAPAIAVTAHARSTDRERVLAAGYDVHIAKPVDPADFIRAIASVSGRAPSAA
jgi:PAS domain S-box-containing protein